MHIQPLEGVTFRNSTSFTRNISKNLRTDLRRKKIFKICQNILDLSIRIRNIFMYLHNKIYLRMCMNKFVVVTGGNSAIFHIEGHSTIDTS